MRTRMICLAVAGILAACSSTSTTTTESTTPQTATAPAPAVQPASNMSSMANHAAMSKDDTIAMALSAAPADITAHAAVVDMTEDGKMTELRPGTNGWVCMAHPEVMCLDKQWQNWADAWVHKTDPKITAVGFGYMMRGDHGASNTDPFATEKTATNNWVVSPPHVMVLTPDTAQLNALPTDPNTGGPWVMWKGTKYAHIMVPTAAMASAMAGTK